MSPTAHELYLRSLYNSQRNVYSPPPEPAKMRTRDEIVEQCKVRLAELEAQVAAVKAKEELPKCKDCRWSGRSVGGRICRQPLIKGFGADLWVGSSGTKLCGPEKALWEPRAHLIQRIIDWFAAPWRDDAKKEDA